MGTDDSVAGDEDGDGVGGDGVGDGANGVGAVECAGDVGVGGGCAAGDGGEVGPDGELEGRAAGGERVGRWRGEVVELAWVKRREECGGDAGRDVGVRWV